MKKLTLNDFKAVEESKYLSYKGKGFEINLEPCMNGFDVAIYDKQLNLIEPKRCTNLDRDSADYFLELIELSLKYANIFYKNYYDNK